MLQIAEDQLQLQVQLSTKGYGKPQLKNFPIDPQGNLTIQIDEKKFILIRQILSVHSKFFQNYPKESSNITVYNPEFSAEIYEKFLRILLGFLEHLNGIDEIQQMYKLAVKMESSSIQEKIKKHIKKKYKKLTFNDHTDIFFKAYNLAYINNMSNLINWFLRFLQKFDFLKLFLTNSEVQQEVLQIINIRAVLNLLAFSFNYELENFQNLEEANALESEITVKIEGLYKNSQNFQQEFQNYFKGKLNKFNQPKSFQQRALMSEKEKQLSKKNNKLERLVEKLEKRETFYQQRMDNLAFRVKNLEQVVQLIGQQFNIPVEEILSAPINPQDKHLETKKVFNQAQQANDAAANVQIKFIKKKKHQTKADANYKEQQQQQQSQPTHQQSQESQPQQIIEKQQSIGDKGGNNKPKYYQKFIKNKEDIACYICNQFGHKAKKCPQYDRETNFKKCYQCGQEGHIVKYCDSYKNNKEEPTQHQQQQQKEQIKIDPQQQQQQLAEKLKDHVCFKCGKKGHFARQCPSVSQQQDQQIQQTLYNIVNNASKEEKKNQKDKDEKKICSICKTEGHKESRCPQNNTEKHQKYEKHEKKHHDQKEKDEEDQQNQKKKKESSKDKSEAEIKQFSTEQTQQQQQQQQQQNQQQQQESKIQQQKISKVQDLTEISKSLGLNLIQQKNFLEITNFIKQKMFTTNNIIQFNLICDGTSLNFNLQNLYKSLAEQKYHGNFSFIYLFKTKKDQKIIGAVTTKILNGQGWQIDPSMALFRTDPLTYFYMNDLSQKMNNIYSGTNYFSFGNDIIIMNNSNVNMNIIGYPSMFTNDQFQNSTAFSSEKNFFVEQFYVILVNAKQQ